jgi:hypothetical protein
MQTNLCTGGTSVSSRTRFRFAHGLYARVLMSYDGGAAFCGEHLEEWSRGASTCFQRSHRVHFSRCPPNVLIGISQVSYRYRSGSTCAGEGTASGASRLSRLLCDYWIRSSVLRTPIRVLREGICFWYCCCVFAGFRVMDLGRVLRRKGVKEAGVSGSVFRDFRYVQVF